MFGTREARRAGLYRQLGAMETAGVPLGTAVHKVIDPDLGRAAKLLDDGDDPGSAWQRAGFSPLEVALVKAGTKGGNLAATFKELEAIFEDRASQARRLLVALFYPVGLMHLAVLIPQLSVLVLKGLVPYVERTFLPLACGWGVLIALVLFVRVARATKPMIVDTIWMSLPIFGGIAKRRAIAHALRVLGALYKAGVPVRDALDSAAEAAILWPIEQAFRRIGERVDQGLTLGDAFLKEEALPLEVRESASTGSLTGQLDETLAGAERRLVEEAKTRQAIVVTATPVVIFLCVALVIGWLAVSAFSGYVDQINNIMK